MFTISQYQIIQDRKDRIVLKLVKGKDFNPEILDRIRNNLEREFDELGDSLDVITQIVDEIPMEKTGKRRLLISKIAQ